MIGSLPAHVHTNADSVALVLPIDEKSCEPGMGLDESKQRQRREGDLCRLNMHVVEGSFGGGSVLGELMEW